VEAIEEESGAEASAKELIHMIEEVRHHGIRAIFVEENGSGSAASIIAAETGAACSTLSMAMSGDDYFSAMYENIDALKEALK
jgi:zinc transport system substrate-binding protein